MISGINSSYPVIHNVFITTLIYKFQCKESIHFQVLGNAECTDHYHTCLDPLKFTVQWHDLEYEVEQVGEAMYCHTEGRGFDSRWGSLGFFVGLIPPFDSASNRNEYRWKKRASAQG